MHSNRYLLPLSAALLLSLSACEKEEPIETCTGSCTVLTGRLLTANGTAPIANVPLTVRWTTDVYTSRQKAEGTTNAQGEYKLSFYIKDDELADGYFTVEYTVDKNRYYDLGASFSYLELPRDTVVVQDYLIPRKAYLKLAITNPGAVPPYSYWTTFSSPYGTMPAPLASGRGGGPAVSWPLNGLPNPLEVPGDQPMIATHAKLRNGVNTFSYDTLTVPAGTTRDYIVTF